MRFGSDDDADSSQVEDRRGSGFGGPMIYGGGGLGIVGVIAYVVIRLLGGNVQVDDGSGRSRRRRRRPRCRTISSSAAAVRA